MLAQTADLSTITYRMPTAEDGAQLHSLIQRCPPLDQNSMYCNLLQCSHFAQTSAIAELNDNLVASTTGFIHPERQDTWFIWQIAVSPEARGQGTAQHLIEHVLNRLINNKIRYIETSITHTNKASWAVFEKFADRLNTSLTTQPLFDHQRHFGGKHPTEVLLRIGPIIGFSAPPLDLSNKPSA